jgi:protocatechuate 3,4-dioxygenase alpha subunit
MADLDRTGSGESMADTRGADTLSLRPTPGLVLGPYYPVAASSALSTRLWTGGTPPDGMRTLRFEGQVIDCLRAPVAQAVVETWHADGQGRYPHPSAPGHEAVPATFIGHGRAITDEHGRFAFDSLVPAPYREGATNRAPHLHVQVTSACDRLVTQVFLPDDLHAPVNRDDRFLASVRDPRALVATARRDDPDLLWIEWIAVVRRARR